MDPLFSVALVLFGCFAILAMAAGLVWWGRKTRNEEVEALEQDIADRDQEIGSLNETIRKLERRRASESSGARKDLRRAVDIADAVARDDLDGVLLHFPSED